MVARGLVALSAGRRLAGGGKSESCGIHSGRVVLAVAAGAIGVGCGEHLGAGETTVKAVAFRPGSLVAAGTVDRSHRLPVRNGVAVELCVAVDAGQRSVRRGGDHRTVDEQRHDTPASLQGKVGVGVALHTRGIRGGGRLRTGEISGNEREHARQRQGRPWLQRKKPPRRATDEHATNS